MTIPNLPTDNLYKFVALFSPFILLIILLYSLNQWIEIRDKTTIHQGELKKIKIEDEKLKRQLKEIRTSIDLLNLKSNRKTFSIVTDSLIIRDRVLVGDTELVVLSNKIDLLINDLFETTFIINSKVIESNTIAEIINNKGNDLLIVYFLIGLSSPILITLTIYGFKKWYNKTQIYQDIILKYQADKIKEEISSKIKEET